MKVIAAILLFGTTTSSSVQQGQNVTLSTVLGAVPNLADQIDVSNLIGQGLTADSMRQEASRIAGSTDIHDAIKQGISSFGIDVPDAVFQQGVAAAQTVIASLDFDQIRSQALSILNSVDLSNLSFPTDATGQILKNLFDVVQKSLQGGRRLRGDTAQETAEAKKLLSQLADSNNIDQTLNDISNSSPELKEASCPSLGSLDATLNAIATEDSGSKDPQVEQGAKNLMAGLIKLCENVAPVPSAAPAGVVDLKAAVDANVNTAREASVAVNVTTAVVGLKAAVDANVNTARETPVAGNGATDSAERTASSNEAKDRSAKSEEGAGLGLILAATIVGVVFLVSIGVVIYMKKKNNKAEARVDDPQTTRSSKKSIRSTKTKTDTDNVARQ